MDDEVILDMCGVEVRVQFEPNTEIITAARIMFEALIQRFEEAGSPWTIDELERLRVVQTNTVIVFGQLIDEEIKRLRELGDTSDVVDIPDFVPEDGD